MKDVANKKMTVFLGESFSSLLRRILLLFTLVASFLFGLYAVHSFNQERKTLLQNLATLSDFTAAQSQEFFEHVGHSLELAAYQVTDKNNFGAYRSLFELILKRHPEIAFISIFDNDGRRILTTFTDDSLNSIDKSVLSPKKIPKKFADNFDLLKQSIDEGDNFSVGRNEFGKMIHQWRIPIRYIRRTKDGKPDFIIEAVIPLSRQTELWGNLELLPDTRIGLYRDDGYLQSRWPDQGLDPNLVYGSSQLPLSPMEDIVKQKKKKGYYEGPNSINGDERSGAYHRLESLPLTAYVSVPTTLVYQYWWNHNYAVVLSFITCIIMFFTFGIILIRRERMHSMVLVARANTDALTSLPNRQRAEEYLNRRIQTSAKTESEFAVLFVDLDQFKYINDNFGHDYGDLVLKEVAARLKAQIREKDMLARLGGDEFIAVIECHTHEQAQQAVARMMMAMKLPVTIKGQMFNISLSIGISMFPVDGQNATELLKKSDIAMYSVKNSTRNGYAFFTEYMLQQIADH
jgi:diguanylate cyclase (GGDEF)-like protein